MAIESFIKYNEAPYAADHIGVYDSSDNKVGIIPLSTFKPAYGERLYRFGLLSDVHRQTDLTTENGEDMQRAFAFFNDKESVEFTVVCGDLCEYVHSTSDYTEWNLYKTSVETYSPSTPVYVTTGNHDCPHSGSFSNSSWLTYTGSNYNKTYELTMHGDHFIFLGEELYSLGSSGTPYLESDLTWLAGKLEEYKMERTFIITHLFFPDYAGNLKNIYPSGNWLGGSQLTTLKGLIDSYPNTIWFSGHSHWKWYLQQYQTNANIYRPNGGGWAVHVPSCASPIDSDGSSTRVSMAEQSEGAIVDVYENYVDIRGINLKDSLYLPIAQYRLDTTIVEPGTIPLESTLFIDGSSGDTSPTWTFDSTTNTLAITFTAVSLKVFFTGAASNCVVTFDSVTFTDPDTGAAIDMSDTALQYIGIYNSTTDPNYSTTSGCTGELQSNVATTNNGTVANSILFNCSSRYVSTGNGTLPVTVTFNNIKFTGTAADTGDTTDTGDGTITSSDIQTYGDCTAVLNNDTLTMTFTGTSQKVLFISSSAATAYTVSYDSCIIDYNGTIVWDSSSDSTDDWPAKLGIYLLTTRPTTSYTFLNGSTYYSESVSSYGYCVQFNTSSSFSAYTLSSSAPLTVTVTGLKIKAS